MSTERTSALTTLHRLMVQQFNLNDIETLCFQMSIDIDEISGTGKSAKVRELILDIIRQGRVQNLTDLLKQARPHIQWPQIPNDFQLSSSNGVMGNSHSSTLQIQDDKLDTAKIAGDHITIGDMNNVQGVALGRQAHSQVTVHHGITHNKQRIWPLLKAICRQYL